MDSMHRTADFIVEDLNALTRDALHEFINWRDAVYTREERRTKASLIQAIILRAPSDALHALRAQGVAIRQSQSQQQNTQRCRHPQNDNLTARRVRPRPRITEPVDRA